MDYRFAFYKKEYFDEIEALILNSYQWENPTYGLSRLEFTNGLHPKFLHFSNVWERTVGVYFLNETIIACAINEGNDDGTVFFLFREKKFAEDKKLLKDMIHFAKTTMSCVKDKNKIQRFVRILIPQWNVTLSELVLEEGFVKEEGGERIRIRTFGADRYPVKLPEGYTFADGNETPPFYLANVHMAAFNYSIHDVPDCANAFSEMRNEKHYDPFLDLCILDPQKRPVAMAIIWYDKRMPYCELEPLGVAFWERRKGLATAILNEASNRVLEKYPDCKGMTGGDQPFYEATGYYVTDHIPTYRYDMEIYPSWDERSLKGMPPKAISSDN
ncbi:N-acetyltransferase [Lacrimispora sp.]|uniref:N-acetyltransferase n=1 Tax=Lacrimispora sp. TaxID=2719234 RepID=UPI0028AF47D8|nr:N-acetyltransferase [Lacrimispora sp.]